MLILTDMFGGTPSNLGLTFLETNRVESITGILLLAAATGAVLSVSADGEDEQAAVDALCGFIESGFGEDTRSA